MTNLVASHFNAALAASTAFVAAQGIMADAAEMEKTIKNLKKSGYGRVNPLLIKVKENFNSRDFTTPENMEHVSGLKESIKHIGVQQPLSVVFEGNEIYLEDGESRLRAVFDAIAEGAEIPFVKVTVGSTGRSEADVILSQIVKNSGKPLNGLEQANVYHRLTNFGWTVKEIAEKVGKSETYINGLLKMREDGQLSELVRIGVVSATLAMQVQREIEAENKAIENGSAEGSAEGENAAPADGSAPATAPKKPRKAGAVLAEVVAAAKANGKDKVTAKDVRKHTGTTKATDASKKAIADLAAKSGATTSNGEGVDAATLKKAKNFERIEKIMQNCNVDQKEDGTLHFIMKADDMAKDITWMVKTFKL